MVLKRPSFLNLSNDWFTRSRFLYKAQTESQSANPFPPQGAYWPTQPKQLLLDQTRCRKGMPPAACLLAFSVMLRLTAHTAVRHTGPSVLNGPLLYPKSMGLCTASPTAEKRLLETGTFTERTVFCTLRAALPRLLGKRGSNKSCRHHLLSLDLAASRFGERRPYMPWDVTNTLGRQHHRICGLDHSVILRGWGGDTKTLPYTREGRGTPTLGRIQGMRFGLS